MPTKKKTINPNPDTDTKKVKHYWVLDQDNRVQEVSEKDIINNPKDYLSQEIWDRPPNQYEIVITLKRKKSS